MVSGGRGLDLGLGLGFPVAGKSERGGERGRLRSAPYPPSRSGMAIVAKRFVGDGGERARSLQREEDGDFAKTPLPAFFFSVFKFFN